jgi:hypothetical protein
MAKNNLAVVEEHLPAVESDLWAMFAEDSGRGVSSAADDNIVPIIYLLQANSPATKKSNPNYVEGAAAGDIWKRNSIHKALVKGDEGMLFQPCYFDKVWVEWRPNRGGLSGVHKERPSDAEEVEVMHEGKPKRKWVRKNGNELVETRQHVGFAEGEAFVIPFSSTGHTVSRGWMQMMNQQYVPGTNKIAPSYAKVYRLSTVERTKDSNSWYIYKVEDLGDKGWVNKEQFLKGKQLFEAFSKGEKTADVVDENISSTSSEEDVPF